MNKTICDTCGLEFQKAGDVHFEYEVFRYVDTKIVHSPESSPLNGGCYRLLGEDHNVLKLAFAGVWSEPKWSLPLSMEERIDALRLQFLEIYAHFNGAYESVERIKKSGQFEDFYMMV